MTTIEQGQDWLEPEAYDELTASQIVAGLPELDDVELEEVAYLEESGKNRVTVLRKVAALQNLREKGLAFAPEPKTLAPDVPVAAPADDPAEEALDAAPAPAWVPPEPTPTLAGPPPAPPGAPWAGPSPGAPGGPWVGSPPGAPGGPWAGPPVPGAGWPPPPPGAGPSRRSTRNRVVGIILAGVVALAAFFGVGYALNHHAVRALASPTMRFDADMKLNAPTVTDQLGDSKLQQLGHDACTRLDQGQSLIPVTVAILGEAGDPSMSPRDLGTIVVAAVQDFCPSHQAEVNAYVAANGG